MAFELPEAVTLARQLNEKLKGQTIKRVHVRPACESLIRQGFVNLQEVPLTGKVIDRVISQGKWIFFKLIPDWNLMFALETGGKFSYYHLGETIPDRYHIEFDFGDDNCLVVQILGWGFARAARDRDLGNLTYPGRLGLSPVDSKEFTFGTFIKIIELWNRKMIKDVLTDQKTIAGIGNGYLQDILYVAKIHPKRKAGEIYEKERIRLYRSIQDTLKEAIRLGGSEFEFDLNNQPGGYQRKMSGHLNGKPCPKCGTRIEKITVSGASCYFCPSCQKI